MDSKELGRMVGVLSISADLAEVERLRLIGVGISQQIKETDAQIDGLDVIKAELRRAYDANQQKLQAVALHVDATFSTLYPLGACAPAEEPLAAAAEVMPESPQQRHECAVCGDVYFTFDGLAQHLRTSHKVSMEPSAEKAPLEGEGASEGLSTLAPSICATCVSAVGCDPLLGLTKCPDHSTHLSQKQVNHRDCTCLMDWEACTFQHKCFGPANETSDNTDCLKPWGEQGRPQIANPGTDHGHDTAARVAQLKEEKAHRDSMCDKWQDCEHAIACFDPDKAALQGTYCLPAETTPLPEGEGPVDSFRSQHDAIVKAAIAAGDDINEHGVFLHPEIIDIPLPKKGGYKAEIRIATNADGGFHYGYDFKKKDHGTSGAPSVTSTVYPTRAAAIGAAIIHLRKTWPEAWTEAKLKAIRNAVGDFVSAIELSAHLEEAKQEAVQRVDESAAQASEVAQHIPDDCDCCGNRGVLDDESFCRCPHGVRARKAGQEELARRKARREALNAAAPEEEKAEVVQEAIQGTDTAPGSGADVPAHMPLDEPVGDCELCCGYGVVEGEANGESTLVPCTCPAGVKVRGGVIVSNCDDCNIGDPNCAECHVSDEPLEAGEPEPLAICCNGSCTANDITANELCLRIATVERPAKDCESFVSVEECKHSVQRRVFVNGILTCGICGASLADAPPVPVKTKLQERCTHPKVFREVTASGEVCKACKLNLAQPGLF